MDLTPHLSVIFIQLIFFAAALLVLSKLLFAPITAGLQRRSEMIEGNRREAEEISVRAAEALEEYEAKLKEARDKAILERLEIRGRGEKRAREILQKARARGEARLQEMKDNVARETETLKEELRAQVPELAREMASRLLGRELT